MFQRAITLSIDSPSASAPTLARSEQLAGPHDVPIDELFSPDFMLQNTDYDSIAAMIQASGLPLVDETVPLDERDALKTSWNEVILLTTRFRTWEEMCGAGATDWVQRQLLGKPTSIGPTPEVEKNVEPDQQVTTEYRSQDLSHVPLERIRNLVEAGIAKRFLRNNEDVVVTPLLLNGGPKQVAFRRKSATTVYPPAGPGGVPHVIEKPPFYEMVGYGPLNYDPEQLADTKVFSGQAAECAQTIAASLEFVLHLLPVGAVADYLVNGQGTGADAVISALGDISLGLGTIAKITVNTRRALLLARSAGAIEGAISVYGYGECVVLGANGEISSAAGKAGEATLRLLGATALLTTKLDRGAWKEVPVVRGELLETPDLKNTPKNFPYFDDWDRPETPGIAVSQKSVDLYQGDLKQIENSLRANIRKIINLSEKIKVDGEIKHAGTTIKLDDIKGKVLRVVVEPGEIRRKHRQMFERLKEYGKEQGLHDIWIIERR